MRYLRKTATDYFQPLCTDAVIRCLIYERIRNNEEVNFKSIASVQPDEVLQAVLDFKGY